MAEFTNAEMADMHLAYGAADCNGRAAVRLYQERYPMRRVPNHQVFARLHQRLCDTGSFQRPARCRERWARTPDIEENVLRHAADTPSASTRAIAHRLGLSQSTVWRVLHENQWHPFHEQRVQTLRTEDYPQRIAFAQWYLQKSAAEPQFPASVLFTDEACFTREGSFNVHNAHVWAVENPHAVRTRAAQNRFAVNVWAGIVGDHLIGPYLLPRRLNGRSYRIFLEDVLPELLHEQHVPQALRRAMWFQHDGAPAHFSNDVRHHLNMTFGHQWIGRGGPVHWPARSPDLTCLDYFFWGYIKGLVYDTPVESDDDLVARISVAASEVRDTPGIFQNVRDSMRRRCHACVTVHGRNFEHLL